MIGTDVSGANDLGNSHNGVNVDDGVTLGWETEGVRIGLLGGGGGNTIAFNGMNGVRVDSNAGRDNRIVQNSIFENDDLGIDLLNEGVTANDSDDPDTGPNNLQNYPVLTGAFVAGDAISFTGSLNSNPSTTFRLEFFSSPECDGSGYGEGEDYIGFVNATTGSGGNVSFTVSETGVTVDAGSAITATATRRTGNLDGSEFSACVTAVESEECEGFAATVVGTNGDDTSLPATAQKDVVHLLEGEDTYDGLQGDDVICGGGNDDVIDGGRGKDTIDGGAGTDVVNGDAGDDILDGGNGNNDEVDGGDRDDELAGGSGTGDDCAGGFGHRQLYGRQCERRGVRDVHQRSVRSDVDPARLEPSWDEFEAGSGEAASQLQVYGRERRFSAG